MNSLPETVVRSEAARIGYFGKSLGELIKMVNKSIENDYHPEESDFEQRAARHQNRVSHGEEKLRRLQELTETYPLSSARMALSAIGILLFVLLSYSGSQLPSNMTLLLVCLSVAGSLIVHYRAATNAGWRSELFFVLSMVGGGIVFSGLSEENVWLPLALAAGLTVAVAIYVLNATVLSAAQATYNQTGAILIRLRLWFASQIHHFWQQRAVVSGSKLQLVRTRKAIEMKKFEHLMNYEYLLGGIARETKSEPETLVNSEPTMIEDYPYVES